MNISDFLSQISAFQIIVLIVLVVSFAVQQIYYWKVFGKVAFTPDKDKKKLAFHNDTGVSVIIYSMNDGENLRENLKKILEQDYPTFEVVVINNGSDDDTDIFLNATKKDYQHLQIRNISTRQEALDDKKIALIVGIRAAKYDAVLFTSPDCTPTSNQWLAAMMSKYSNNNCVIIGHTHYQNVSSYVRCDMFFRMLHYLGMAMCNYAYMSDGKNYAYAKQLFIDKGGLDFRITVERDDIIVINKLSNKVNTAIELSPISILNSSQKWAWYNWSLERVRLEKSFNFHGSKNKMPAFWEIFSRVLFYASAIIAMTQGLVFMIFAIVLLLAKFITMISIFINAETTLKEKSIAFQMIMYDLVSPFVNLKLRLLKPKLYK